MRSKTKQFLHYEKVLSKKDQSNCDILLLKTWWQSGLRRQIQKHSFEPLVLECVRGFEYYNCQILRSKVNNLFEAVLVRMKRERDEAEFTLQESVIENRLKRLRYTISEGRMAERSKAPDSRNSPLRLLVHKCVRVFESHSYQTLRSKSQQFAQSSFCESQMRSKTKLILQYEKV